MIVSDSTAYYIVSYNKGFWMKHLKTNDFVQILKCKFYILVFNLFVFNANLVNDNNNKIAQQNI